MNVLVHKIALVSLWKSTYNKSEISVRVTNLNGWSSKLKDRFALLGDPSENVWALAFLNLGALVGPLFMLKLIDKGASLLEYA